MNTKETWEEEYLKTKFSPMAIVEITYRPTTASVSRKNSKDQLAHCVLNIWELAHQLPDDDKHLKDTIIRALLRVL